MIENENIRIIKEHFAAFGRGDIRQALSMVAENVDWQSPVTRSRPKEITWAEPRRSREEVMRLFQELSDKVPPEMFEIFGFMAAGHEHHAHRPDPNIFNCAPQVIANPEVGPRFGSVALA